MVLIDVIDSIEHVVHSSDTVSSFVKMPKYKNDQIQQIPHAKMLKCQNTTMPRCQTAKMPSCQAAHIGECSAAMTSFLLTLCLSFGRESLTYRFSTCPSANTRAPSRLIRRTLAKLLLNREHVECDPFHLTCLEHRNNIVPTKFILSVTFSPAP